MKVPLGHKSNPLPTYYLMAKWEEVGVETSRDKVLGANWRQCPDTCISTAEAPYTCCPPPRTPPPRQMCSRNRLQKETQTNKQTTKNGFCGSYKPKQLNTSQPPTRQNELAKVRRKGSWQLALWKQQWNRKHGGAWPQLRSPSPTPSAGRGNGKFTWRLERKLVKHWNNFKGYLLFSF